MVQRQQGHPAEPRPTARFQPGVELRYLPPASAAVVVQGSVPIQGGMLWVGGAAGTSNVLPS